MLTVQESSHPIILPSTTLLNRQRGSIIQPEVKQMTTTNSTTAEVQSNLPAPTRTLLTVKQLAASQPGLNEGGIRWELFHRQTNGLAESGAVIQHGRKILIDPDRYIDWIVNGTEGAK